MENLTHYPALLFAVAFIVVARFSRGRLVAQTPREEQKDALSLILAASLTLLALVIGFNFSMATNRYAAIALCCNVLFGYRMQTTGKLALMLPLVVSISLLLIADIDAPRHGLIHVSPQNLQSLAKSLEH